MKLSKQWDLDVKLSEFNLLQSSNRQKSVRELNPRSKTNSLGKFISLRLEIGSNLPLTVRS